MHTLLLIDDDREMLEITSSNFRDKEYTVYTANSGVGGLRLFEQTKPDCVILDIMMPDTNGFEVCRRIRKTSNVPVIFLTGRISEDDKVSGLLLGADDYVEKPFGFRELEARVQTAIRRAAPAATGASGILSFPPLEIDITAHRATCAGEDLYLTAREYSLLYMLAISGGEVVTYEDIGKQIWGSYREDDRGTVMVSVSRLRKKMENNPVTAQMIETVWSIGYKFVGRRAAV